MSRHRRLRRAAAARPPVRARTVGTPVRRSAEPAAAPRASSHLHRARRLGHRPHAGWTRTPSRCASPALVQRLYADKDTFGEFLGEQDSAQTTAAKYNYAEKPYTTVGFEHEFAQMKDGPLLDTTHVELAESEKVRMPLTGLGFSLETDADDAVELVSPPFMLETVSETAPIPRPEDVAKVDHMIQERLAQVVDQELTFGQLLEALGEDPGIDFRPRNVTVTPSNVNPGITTDFSKLTTEEEPLKAVVKQSQLVDMTIAKGRKKSLKGAISSQVNFATDAPTYEATQQASEVKPDPDTQVFLDLEESVFKALVACVPKEYYWEPTPALTPFLLELARRLASTLAARSIERVEALKKEMFKTKGFKAKKSDFFGLHAALRSHVKDTKGLWLKDTVENYGLGLLEPIDWYFVWGLVRSGELRKRLADLKLSPKVKGKERDELTENLEVAKEQMTVGLEWLKTRIYKGKWFEQEKETKTRRTLSGMGSQPPFGSHDPERLGVRQDTFLTLSSRKKKSRPELWGPKVGARRLHVVETRGSSLETLINARIADLVKTTKMKDKEIAVTIGKTLVSIEEDAVKRLEAASKKLSKKETLPFRVTILEDLVKDAREARERLATEKYVGEVRDRLGG